VSWAYFLAWFYGTDPDTFLALPPAAVMDHAAQTVRMKKQFKLP
jgi:hypothetical protein